MPRKNSKATQSDFEQMSPSKIRALLESLQYEWRERTGKHSPRPADRERW